MANSPPPKERNANTAYIGSWKHFVFVFVCVCVSLSLSLSFCKYLSRSLSSPDDKLSENIYFKIYGLYGLEHHTVEIYG